MKPICFGCRCFMRPEKNGINFVEMMKTFPDGLGQACKNEPYRLWMGDLWRCLKCGTKVIVGVGSQCLGEHYEPDFAEQVKKLEADKVEICET